MNRLFDPLKLRSVKLPHRLAVAPMCQYSATDGYPNDWHLVHLGSRAVGGASLIFTEATAVTPDGRITPADLGIWDDSHIDFFARIARFLHQQGSVAGIQLAHAGRKGSARPPWEGGAAIPLEEGGWIPFAPSPLPFSEKMAVPQEMTLQDITSVRKAFVGAASRALHAGFRVIEIHAAHGYLLHEFLSPISNHRTDSYGGSFEGRIRMLLEVTAQVRVVWPETLPLFVRISTTDWDDRGWTVDESVELARRLKPLGVDVVDCSSGGSVAMPVVQFGSGYQSAIAERIRREAGVMTAAVGSITSAAQADHIVCTGQADLVLMARQMLRDPYMAVHSAQALDVALSWPVQYLRAAPAGLPRREPVMIDPAET
jgi:2,4-dienoyl-CoA reductase-like NADH-dependent reductase (Old Yellow Enzyme family)